MAHKRKKVKYAGKTAQRVLARCRKLEQKVAKYPSLLSARALAGAAVIVARIRKEEAASMERLWNADRLTEKDLQITINARAY